MSIRIEVTSPQLQAPAVVRVASSAAGMTPPQHFGPLSVAQYGAGPYPLGGAGPYKFLAVFGGDGSFIAPRYYTIDSNGNLTFVQGFRYNVYAHIDGFFS